MCSNKIKYFFVTDRLKQSWEKGGLKPVEPRASLKALYKHTRMLSNRYVPLKSKCR
jgi:hypothetical protein